MRTFVHARTGAPGWQCVLEAMSDDDREHLRALVMVGWYDLELQLRLLRTIDAVLGDGDLGLVPEIGRFEADEDLTKVHRLFIRLANPGYLLEKSGEYWGRFYDTGTWKVTRKSRTAASGTLTDLGVVDEAFCAYLCAYIERMWELAGAKDRDVRHVRCRARGDAVCQYSGTWR